MDGDMLGMAFKMIEEFGLVETLKLILNIIPEPPSLVAVQEGYKNVTRGDHLVHKTALGWNSHFYVADNLGEGRLRVYGCFLEGNDNLFIEEELMFKPVQARKVKVEERILHEPNVTQKLKKKLYESFSNYYNEERRVDVFKRQRSNYDLLYDNSEHFVSYVKTGQAISQIAIDIASFIKKHIFVQAVRNYNMEMVKILQSTKVGHRSLDP